MRIVTFLCACLLAVHVTAQQTIDLSGQWQFALDSNRLVRPDYILTETVTLPGTTDTNHKGDTLSRFDETTHLSRRWHYTGRAWYKRSVTIPAAWQGQTVSLLLERSKPSEVYVDARLAGTSNDISTPQLFDLTAWLTPGRHDIAIMVDNSTGVPQQLYASSHAYTEDTQTNWNGIIGSILLCTGEVAPPPAPAGETVHPNFRDFGCEGQQFRANGHPVFLRGRHDACVWPLTGHVPMELAPWRWYMAKCKEYGLNHVRFHSWCPPEAAFTAADEAGIVLQPELPFWGDFNAEDSVLMAFLHKEGENILRWYGHHPSFRLFALGNELWGSIAKMSDFIEDFRRLAPDKLFTFGSNYYLGYQGVQPGMDYFTTCRVGGEGWGHYDTHTRGSFSFADAADGGLLNHQRPNTSFTFGEGCSRASVPVISHETGQFQIYPSYQELKSYTGVLRPCNLEVFKHRLQQAGMADQAEAFHRASGQWAMQLYKAEIEADLRTRNMAGFQLLDLQDYPGQGAAYVGVLDAFQNTKGLISSEEWREFCAPVVPLLVSDSYCFTSSEGISARLQIANYGGETLKGQTLRWQLDGGLPQTGRLTIPDGKGLLDVGELTIGLRSLKQATRLTLRLSIEGTPYHNTYTLWSYPDQQELNKKGIIMTRSITDEIGKKLERGARVLLMPEASELCVGGLFMTDYWNYRMFKTISENNKKEVSPGTLGILCNPRHPLFSLFPTEAHTSWQWFPVLKASHPMMLDHADELLADSRNDAKGYRPIVQVIDNIERNHKLGLVFEFQVGQGRLLVVMSDLEAASAYPEGRQFYASVLNYMHTKAFAPATRISLADLRRLLSTPVEEGQLDELNNISPY